MLQNRTYYYTKNSLCHKFRFDRYVFMCTQRCLRHLMNVWTDSFTHSSVHSHSEFWFHLSFKPHVSSLRLSLSALRKEDVPGVSPEEHRLVFILKFLLLPLQYCSQSGNHHCRRCKDPWGFCVSHLSIPFLLYSFSLVPFTPGVNILLRQSDHKFSVLNTGVNRVQNILRSWHSNHFQVVRENKHEANTENFDFTDCNTRSKYSYGKN